MAPDLEYTMTITSDALTISLLTLACLRLLGMLVFLDLFIQKRESKHLLLALGWGCVAAGSLWGVYTHLAWGGLENYFFSLMAGLGTFWIICGALLYFSAVSWRFVGAGSLLILLYGLLPLAGLNLGPSPGVLVQLLISLLLTFFAIFKRKAFLEIAQSSYFWLVALAVLSDALTLAFGLGLITEGGMALGFAGTSVVQLVAIIFFLHLEYNLSARNQQRSERNYRSMVQQLLEGFYAATSDGILLDHNLEFCRILGLDPDKDYRGLHLPNFWQDPADRADYLAALQKDGLIRSYLINAKKADGEATILLVNSRLVEAGAGDPPRIEGTFLDITERKRAEQAQARQQALLEAVYRNAPLVMMVVDEERRVCQVNGLATQVAGRSAEDMLGLRGGEALRCLHALDSPEGCGFGPFCQQCMVRSTVLDTLASGATHQQVEASLPFEIAGKEEKRTFLLSATPLGLADEPLALVTMLDITQRVRAQRKLQAAGEHWKQTFRAMRDGVVLLDAEHRILQYNRAFAEIYEDADGRLAGRFCYGVVHDMDCRIEGCPFVRAKTTCQRESMQMEIEGSIYNIIVDPILDERGELSGAVHIMTDITDLVQAEGRARRLLAQQQAVNQLSLSLGEDHDLEAIYGTIYDHVREIVDTKTFMVTSYESRAQLIGAEYIVDQGTVQDVTSLPSIPLEPPGRGTQSRVIRSGEPFYAPDFRLAMQTTDTKYQVAKNGTLSEGMPLDDDAEAWDDFIRSAVYVPMKVQGEVIGVMQAQSSRPDAYSQEDIELLSGMANVAAVAVQNARLVEQLEETVAERTAELEEKVEKLTQSERAMLYMVEDLNQITADLKAERRKLEISNQELESFAYSVSHDLRAPLRAINGYAGFLAQDYAGKLDANGHRFIDVIQQSAAKMDRLISDLLNLSRVSRTEMSRDSVDMVHVARFMYHEVASEAEQEAFEIEIQSLPSADCDLTLIKQVWQNLIENALKYSANAPVKQITIGAQEGDGEMVYWIKDRGAGFDPQYQHKLFGVFQRLHSEEQYQGTGVGLAIVQRIIRRHGGRVWAEGQIDQGATFYFALPVE